MKTNQTVTERRKAHLLEITIGKLRVILGDRNPSVHHCVAAINEYMSQVVEDQEQWLREAAVTELGLPLKTVNTLQDAGYRTVRSLISVTASELLREYGVGDSIIVQIRQALAERRLALRGEVPLRSNWAL